MIEDKDILIKKVLKNKYSQEVAFLGDKKVDKVIQATILGEALSMKEYSLGRNISYSDILESLSIVIGFTNIVIEIVKINKNENKDDLLSELQSHTELSNREKLDIIEEVNEALNRGENENDSID